MASLILLSSFFSFFFFSLLFGLSDSRPNPSSSSSSSAQQFLLPLTHSLANSPDLNSTAVHHLLREFSLRSAARHHRLRHQQPQQQQQQQLSLPLSAGSDYTLSLSLPTSATPFPLYMDTGSDLVWLPCSPFQCILCDGKPKPSPPLPLSLLSSSSPVPCDSPLCSAAHSSLPSSDLCAIAGCRLDDIETHSCPSSSICPPFYYAYGDGSLVANLRQAPISIGSLKVTNFTIGCAHTALAEPVGVAGFGGGALSLPAQLASAHPSLASRFSYCLVSHSFRSGGLLRPSPLILGRSSPSDPDPSFVYTPMLRNPKYHYFYTVSLEAISVAGVRIEANPELMSVNEKGNGGMVVDSGTTFTMLPTTMFSRLAAEFHRRMSAGGFRRAMMAEAETGLGPCYYYGGGRQEEKKVPALELRFGWNATVGLPRRNYFTGFESGGKAVGCLMVMDGGEDGNSGPAATLGNFQQQGMEVAYDLEGRRVGFARRRCGALWNSLSRGGR